jgi:hypothetical protein
MSTYKWFKHSQTASTARARAVADPRSIGIGAATVVATVAGIIGLQLLWRHEEKKPDPDRGRGGSR